MSETFDAVVMGGGLAGSSAAWHLARRGARVALLEAGRFPRHKVCGEFISPEARPILRRLGVEETLLAAGAREGFKARLIAGEKFLEVSLPTPALAVSRAVLDEVLWKNAIACGAQGFENTRVRAVQQNGVLLVQTTQNEFCARAFIEATGRHSILKKEERAHGKSEATGKASSARYIGLKTHFSSAHLEAGVTELHTFKGGYCGMVRVEGDLTNTCLLVRYEIYRATGARTPDDFFAWALTQCPLLKKRIANAQLARPWLATGNISFALQPPQDDVLRCGDAAAFIHPFTGDGMAMALHSGELAGATLAVRLDKGDAGALFASAWRRQFAVRLNWAGALAPLFLQPVAARAALLATQACPSLAPFLLAKTRG